MDNGQRFAYTGWGETGLRPYLPLTLRSDERSLSTIGLLDTGSMVNVLPYETGTELGLRWELATNPVELTGNLGQFEARAVILYGTIASYEPVRLAFAWTKATNVPLLLGQVNFFMAFNACFYRSENFFEVQPKRVI